MRRTSIFVFSAIVLLGSVLAGSRIFVSAQDTASTGFPGHPLVGTWLLDTDTADPTNAPDVAMFTADGGYISVDVEGVPSLGAWEATGNVTGMLNITAAGMEDDGTSAGFFTIRMALEVDDGGTTLSSTYTFELVGADGTQSGEFGPGRVIGTRVMVEPMGVPVGPLSDVFGSDLFDEEGEDTSGTPATSTVPTSRITSGPWSSRRDA